MAGHRDGALWGSFVAEALCMGPHWVYDMDALRENYGSITGYTLPTVMDYHVGRQPGDFTHLGDQALLLLESIEKRNGLDRDGWAADWLEWAESYEGYHDAASKQTRRHLQAGDPVETAGSDSTELAGASRIAAVVYYYWDSPDEMMRRPRNRLTSPTILTSSSKRPHSSFTPSTQSRTAIPRSKLCVLPLPHRSTLHFRPPTGLRKASLRRALTRPMLSASSGAPAISASRSRRSLSSSVVTRMTTERPKLRMPRPVETPPHVR